MTFFDGYNDYEKRVYREWLSVVIFKNWKMPKNWTIFATSNIIDDANIRISLFSVRINWAASHHAIICYVIKYASFELRIPSNFQKDNSRNYCEKLTY